MENKNKQLLLKVLCAMSPYGFKYQVQYGDTSVRDVKKFILDGEYSLFDTWMVHEIKPYLRPMSSMTDMEKQQFNLLSMNRIVSDGFGKNIQMFSLKCIDWLNKYHFDYCGLIPMGMALPAKEGMYNN